MKSSATWANTSSNTAVIYSFHRIAGGGWVHAFFFSDIRDLWSRSRVADEADR
jgi:hypothetical protein